MIDDQHIEILELFSKHPVASLICPDYMLDRLRQACPGIAAYPYCAASALGREEPEAVIVHKGMLRALGWQRLAAALAADAPVLANDVFLVFQRGARPRPGDTGMDAHIAPLLAFCRHWQTLSRRSAPSRLAVVASAWNLGNCGDDALSLAAAAICRRLGFEEVTLLGPSGPLEAIERAGLVLLGGGGLLYDDDIANTANYTAPLRFAAACGVPHAALGVGTQGIRTALGRAAYHEALAGAALIAARDATDVAVLRDDCGLRRAEAGADRAFALPELEPHWFPPVTRPARARPLALLSLGYSRETPGLQGEPLLRSILGLARSLGATHDLLLARHSTDDAEVHAEAARILGIRDIDLAAIGVPMAIATYAAADIAITSRYHGTIFAALTGTPVATVCDGPAKLGRLVGQALPSLAAAATSLDETGNPLLSGQELARRARPAARAEIAAQRTAAMASVARLTAALGRPEAVRATTMAPAAPAAPRSLPVTVPAPPAAPPPWSPALLEACTLAAEQGGLMLTIGDPPPPVLPPAVMRRIGRHGTAQADRSALSLALPAAAARRILLDPARPWPGSIASALVAARHCPVAVLRLAGSDIAMAPEAIRAFDPTILVLERPPSPPSMETLDALLVAIGLSGRVLLVGRGARLAPVPLFEAEPALRHRSILCTEAAWAALQTQRAVAA